jgi:thymidylate synthase
MLWLDGDYKQLVNRVIAQGYPVEGRNGRTYMLPGQTIAHDMQDGFPIIGSRRIFWRGVAGELAAFLEGSTSLARFEELGCPYWRHNSGGRDNLGPIYGAQWRNFGGVDQLQELIEGLQNNPSGRRHVMTTWNPPELELMCLPPCHLLTQFHVTGKLLHQTVYMRSVDLCLGLPSDLVLYGLLHMLVAKELGLISRKLTFMFGDAHVYEDHVELWSHPITGQDMAPVPEHTPCMTLTPESSLWNFRPDHCTMFNYTPSEAIKYALK